MALAANDAEVTATQAHWRSAARITYKANGEPNDIHTVTAIVAQLLAEVQYYRDELGV